MNNEEQQQTEIQAIINSLANQRNQALDALAAKDAMITVLQKRLAALEEKPAEQTVVVENA